MRLVLAVFVATVLVFSLCWIARSDEESGESSMAAQIKDLQARLARLEAWKAQHLDDHGELAVDVAKTHDMLHKLAATVETLQGRVESIDTHLRYGGLGNRTLWERVSQLELQLVTDRHLLGEQAMELMDNLLRTLIARTEPIDILRLDLDAVLAKLEMKSVAKRDADEKEE